jgi:hypothetical protein
LKRLSQDKHSSLGYLTNEKVSKHCRQMPLDTDSTIDSHLVKIFGHLSFLIFNKRHYFNFANCITGTGGLEAHGTA